MQALVDRLNSTTGWAGPLLSNLATNANEQFVAGPNSSFDQLSLRLDVPASSSNDYVEKVFSTPFDLTNFKEIVFSVASLDNGLKKYKQVSEFSYRIDFDSSGNGYYIPVNTLMHSITIDVSDLTQIEKIRITALKDNTDTLYFSYMMAIKTANPNDIMNSLKDTLEYDREREFSGVGIQLQTGLALASGDSEISLSTIPKYLKRFSKILIKDGSNSETHRVDEVEMDLDGNKKLHFTNEYDGSKIINDYTSAELWLEFAIEISGDEREAVSPSINIWGFENEEQVRNPKMDTVLDTFKTDGTVSVRQEGGLLQYILLIDAEAESPFLISEMSKLIKNWILREILWVNGRLHDIAQVGSSSYLNVSTIDVIPKQQYQVSLEVREDIWPRRTQSFPLISQSNVTVNPVTELP